MLPDAVIRIELVKLCAKSGLNIGMDITCGTEVPTGVAVAACVSI